MKCENCGESMFNIPLHRTNPKGQPDAGWMCEPCISNKEPELYNNLKADKDFDIANDIMDIVKSIPIQIPSNSCPKCGASEIDDMSPSTVYGCGSSDYDQIPNTFKQSDKCSMSVSVS